MPTRSISLAFGKKSVVKHDYYCLKFAFARKKDRHGFMVSLLLQSTRNTAGSERPKKLLTILNIMWCPNVTLYVTMAPIICLHKHTGFVSGPKYLLI